MAEAMSQHHAQMPSTFGLAYYPTAATRPQLPALNLAQVKAFQSAEEQSETLQQARDQWEAAVQHPSMSARGASTSLTRRLVPVHTLQSNTLTQPHPPADTQHVPYAQQQPPVPRLNLQRQDGVGLATAGGIEESASARQATASMRNLNSSTQQGAQRTAMMARPAYSSMQPVQQLATATTSGQIQAPAVAAVEEATTSEAHVPWESGSITPAQALRRYGDFMSPFEQSEVLEYPQVYFVGRCVAQKIQGSPHSSKANHGYDDERGDYTVVTNDHLSYRYEVLGVLGKGSFGQVLRCHDFKTGELRAVKVIRNKKRFHHQALVEVKILEHLRNRDGNDENNVIHLEEYFYFRNHLCISFELLSVNLYEFVKQNNFSGLNLPLIRRFAAQIIVSLQFMKQNRIIHCDLKPENILLRRPDKAHIKVIDFGSSCFVDERVYTYIQSRFYRSPEVILGLPYGCEIDIWSLGCILAELYTGYPLFPGQTEQDQLLCIMEVLDVPPRDLVEQASRGKAFFDSKGDPRMVPNSKGKARIPGSKCLAGVLKCSDAGFLDFLEKCFKWNPEERITPDMALQHPWIAEHSPSPTHRLMGRAKSEMAKPMASLSARKLKDVTCPPALASAQHDQAQRRDQTGMDVDSVSRTASDMAYSRQAGGAMLSARDAMAAAQQHRNTYAAQQSGSNTSVEGGVRAGMMQAGAALMPTPRTQLTDLMQLPREKLTPRTLAMKDTLEPAPLSARWLDQGRPSPMQLDVSSQLNAVNRFLPQLGHAK